MHKTIAICLIAFCVMPLWPGTSTVLPELMRPTVVEVDASQNKIFIVDNTSVLVYSLNDLKLFKKIGRKGEGPQEFKYITSIHLLKKSLLVNSSGKISLFKKDGTFIKEIKSTSGADFIRIGGQFVGMDMEIIDKLSHLTVNLYDLNLKPVKELNRRNGSFLGSKHLDPILIYGPLGPELRTIDENALVKANDGVFKVFTPKGEPFSTITPKYEKVAVTQLHRKKILVFYKTNSRTKANFPALKKRFKFPEHFPLVRNYTVDNSRIYILTFNEKKEKKEVLVYDAKGAFLEKLFLPLTENNVLEIYPYTIKDDMVYQLVEGDEDWQLTITGIKNKM